MLSARALGLGLMMAVADLGATESAFPQAPALQQPPGDDIHDRVSFGRRADVWHDAMYAWVQRELRELDQRLAVESAETEEVLDVSSPFRIEWDLEVFDREGQVDMRGVARFDIDLQLPHLKRRLRLFLTTDELSETLTDVARGLRGGVRIDAFPGADFELGVKVDAPPVAFAALRWSAEQQHGPWRSHPFAKVFVDSSRGPGVGAAWVIDHWRGQVFSRSASSWLWLSRRPSAVWSQTLVFARAREVLREGRHLARAGSRDVVDGWGLELSVVGEDVVFEREVALFYKRPLHSDWWFASVRPYWRSARDGQQGGPWRNEAGILLGVDLLFWAPAGQRANAPR